MLVSRILGDCPGCGGKDRYGNVSVRGNHILRGCMTCKYTTNVWLPEVRKKIIYLDQFFFSGAFRAGEKRFLDAAKRIKHLSALQLLVAPFSSIHEDETHQWRGYGDKNKNDLMAFIKATSRGHEFEPAYEVEQTQVIRAFKAFLNENPTAFILQEHDAIRGNIHEWDDYFRIDVGRYIGDIELIRDLKRQSVEGLVSYFEGWRKSTNTFDQDVLLEVQAAGRGYIDSYLMYAARVASGDYSALLDSPIMSMVVQSMLQVLPENTSPEERLKQVARFFVSEHFSQVPYRGLTARTFATLKDMVKRGAFTNRESAIKRLSGFLYDVKHIATYAPYCDAFVIDQPMAALVADPRVGLKEQYGVRIFSLNNWEDLFLWLDTIEAGMSDEHRAGLAAAYP
jgi:hypothetical protein